MCCLPFGRGRVFFAVWAGPWAPPKQQKQHDPAKTAKSKHAPAPSPNSPRQNLIFSKKHLPAQTVLFGRGSCFFCCCLGGWGRGFLFLLCGRTGEKAFLFVVWAGGLDLFFDVFCYLGGGVFAFFCLGGVRVYLFSVWAGCVITFVLFGRWRFFFFSCCLGGGREFTHLPVCLARL